MFHEIIQLKIKCLLLSSSLLFYPLALLLFWVVFSPHLWMFHLLMKAQITQLPNYLFFCCNMFPTIKYLWSHFSSITSVLNSKDMVKVTGSRNRVPPTRGKTKTHGILMICPEHGKTTKSKKCFGVICFYHLQYMYLALPL